MARDPFEVLGVARDASLAEARDAYRRTVELFHPDRLRELRDAVRAEGERRLREANEAMRAVQRSFGRPLNAATASPLAPSDAATEAEARLYDAQLRELDRAGAYVPGSKIVWGGDAARAVLARLRHEFRRDEGPVRMVDWGSYRIDLPGSAMVGFLGTTLGVGDGSTPSSAPRGVLGDRLPVVARSVAVPATLADALVHLRVDVTYSLTADVY
jgi:hypothetical protein